MSTPLVIAQAYFNYHGYAPKHRDGVVILQCAVGFSVQALVWMPEHGTYYYQVPAVGKYATEAEAREAGNTMYLEHNGRLAGQAEAKDKALALTLAALEG